MSDILEQFNAIKDALSSFEKGVKSDLEKIREYKSEVLSLRSQMVSDYSGSSYIRDESRLIISAPEIIIGNVDQWGALLPNNLSPQVTIRGNSVSIEGSSGASSGRVVVRAPQITHFAVNPGVDGSQNIVESTSQVVSHARSIGITSEDVAGVFTVDAAEASPPPGVSIDSTSEISMRTGKSSKTLASSLKDKKTAINKELSDVTSEISDCKSSLSDQISTLSKLLKNDSLDLTSDNLTANFIDAEETTEYINNSISELYATIAAYFSALAKSAEMNRTMDELEEQISDLNSGSSKYDSSSDGGNIYLTSENVSVISAGREGTVRTNSGAGFSVTANNISLMATDDDGTMLKKSNLKLNAENISISSADTKFTGSNREMPAEGSISIVSKDIAIEAVDYECKDNKIDVQELTTGGSIKMRAAALDLSTNKKDGSTDGNITLNAKDIEIKSVELNDSGKEEKMTTKGSLLLLSETLYVGSRNKESMRSDYVQISSKEVAAFADDTLEVSQGSSGTAHLQLKSNKTTLVGSDIDLSGKLTVMDAAIFKDKATIPTISADNIDASKSLKGPNTSDGISVPSASAGGTAPKTSIEEKELADKSSDS